MADCESNLAEAKAALHALKMGRSIASTSTPDGASITYRKADIGRLEAYVRELEAECGATAGTLDARRAPGRVVY